MENSMQSSSSPASEHFDVIVAGAGVGGVSAAILAARAGARVALLEAGAEIGGTGVHSPVGLVCTGLAGVRNVDAAWIRHALKEAGQFVEGECAAFPGAADAHSPR
jgi:flavin-dependent dehydrogenase